MSVNLNGDSQKISEEKIEKTPGEILEEKKKLFNEKPEEFFHFSEFVIAIRKVGNSLQTLIGRTSRADLEQAVTRVTYEATKMFDLIEVRKLQEDQERQKLLKPGNGGVMNFVRKR